MTVALSGYQKTSFQRLMMGSNNRNYTHSKNNMRELKYCPECKRVFQHFVENLRIVLEHYENIPTLGKPRIICPTCKVGMNETKN